MTPAPAHILALDTSLAACSACCLAPGEALPAAHESLRMERGHAEALVPLLDRVVSRLPAGFAALARVAVTVGPGSFTGIRVGVAAARAVGLACKVPVVGVSTLSALAAPAVARGLPSAVVAAVDAHHGNVYVQGFAPDGATQLGPAVMPVAEAAAALGPGPVRVVGSGAAALAAEARARGITADVDPAAPVPDIAFVARLGLLADPERAPPRPAYLKAPDAKPPAAAFSLF